MIMKAELLRYMAAGLMALALACSTEPPQIAGSTSTTGNARVAGIVFDEAGAPRAGAAVQLRRVIITAAGDSVAIAYETTSDSRGAYYFDFLEPGKYVLYSRDSLRHTTAMRPKLTVAGGETLREVDLNLASPVTIRGRVMAGAGVDLRSMRVCLPGLDSSVAPDAAGEYVLPPAPRAEHDLAFVYGATVNFLPVDLSDTVNDTLSLNDVRFATQTGSSVAPYSYYDHTQAAAFSVTVIEQSAPGLLLENFDDGVNQNALVGALYPVTDQLAGRWQVRLSSHGHQTLPAVLDSAAITGGAFRGRSLQVAFAFNEGQSPDGGLGVGLGARDSFYDLSTMDALSFYARGSGSVRVVFHTDSVNATGEGAFYHDISIGGQWGRVAIAADSLRPLPGTLAAQQGITWADAARGVTAISIVPLSDGQLWLDELYLIGVSPNALGVTVPGWELYLIDDFEQGDDWTRWTLRGHDSFWYSFTTGQTTTVPDLSDTHLAQAMYATGYSGKGAHVVFALDTAANQLPSGIGFAPERAGYVDFRSLTAISFAIKGRGTVRLSIPTKKIKDYPSGQNWGHFGKNIALPAEWQVMRILPSELQPEPDSPPEKDGLTWAAVADSVDRVNFVTWKTPGDTVELWLDDVYLEGVRP
jgi:hypothetical protein